MLSSNLSLPIRALPVRLDSVPVPLRLPGAVPVGEERFGSLLLAVLCSPVKTSGTSAIPIRRMGRSKADAPEILAHASTPIPRNTTAVPNHWPEVSLWSNRTTDSCTRGRAERSPCQYGHSRADRCRREESGLTTMVTSFLVTVTITNVSEPKPSSVSKMKSWPRAPVKE